MDSIKQQSNNNQISLNSLLKKTKENLQKNNIFYKRKKNWNFKSLDDFIVSFESLSEKENVKNSKKYGNIIKTLTKEILEVDVGNIDLETKRVYEREELLEIIKQNKDLFNKFKKMYDEIFKRNFWKMQMPYSSLYIDFSLDREKNDYNRFLKIYKFLIKKEKVYVKNLEKNKKEKINIDDLINLKKQNKHIEIELKKILIILAKRIKRKKNGEEFLNKYDIF